MAVQTGMGLSKIIIFIGAGYTGSILLRNGNLSDILTELQVLFKDRSGEKSGDDTSISDGLASQVHRLAMEVRQLASARPITVLNGSSGQGNVTALIIPAASLGLLGYGYMWWKGISFSDFMYVTKKSMASAVSGMTKHLEQVSAALAKTKKHLTERIQNLDDKLDDQKVISSEIKIQVVDARGKLDMIGSDMKMLEVLVSGLNKKIESMEDKQDFACAGVAYLLKFVSEQGAQVPENMLLDFSKMPNRRSPYLDADPGSLKGLLHLTAKVANPDGCKNEVLSQKDTEFKSLSFSRSAIKR